MDRITAFIDPTCPWTWATAQWLRELETSGVVCIEWRSLSLPVLNRDREIPERFRAGLAASTGMHRLFAAVRAARRDDLVAPLYLEFGRRVHHDGVPPTADVARAVAEAVGAGAWVDAIDDTSWDEGIEASTAAAMDAAGPDVGSPVLVLGDHAIFGPIVSPPPSGEDATRLYEQVRTMVAVPGFYELKRGRRSGPQPGPRP